MAFYNIMTLNFLKTHISAISVHKYHKSCSSLIWPFYSFLQPQDLNCRKTPNSAILVHKYHEAFS